MLDLAAAPPGGSSRTPMSMAEYDDLGEAKRHEWYDGLCVVNPPLRRHVLVTKRLERLLDDACPPGYLVYQEWGWWTAGGRFIPDLMVAPAEAPDEPWLREPPLLVVEVLSPGTRDVDLGRKRELYAAAGLACYWAVDPDERALTVFAAREGLLEPVQTITSSPATTVGVLAVEVALSALLP